MDPREELAMLRRLAELEAKAAGGKVGAGNTAPRTDNAGTLANIVMGALKGASDIGSTLLAPVRWPLNAGLEAVGLQPISRDANAQFFRENADPDSLAFKGGELATDIAGTAGAGGVLAKGVRAIPALARAVPGLAPAIESGGFSLGGAPAATTAGRLAGNVATRVGGGAIAGSASAGMINPSEIVSGAMIGGAIPVVGKVAGELGRGAKAAFIDPLVNKDKLMAAALQRAVGPGNIQQTIAGLNRAPMTPGVRFSAGEASGNPALNAMEDTFRAMNPGGALNAQAQGNRVALAQPIRDLAQDEMARAAAVQARGKAVDQLYETAKQADVPVDPVISGLLQRPALQQAARESTTNAANRGAAIGVQSAAPSPTGILDASGNMIMAPGTPGTLSGKFLHEMKMALDSARDFNPMGGANKAQSGAIGDAAGDFATWLETKIPEYGQARQTFADMSRPINQMDVGKLLAEKLLPATSGDIPASLNAATFARALQNPDQVARLATGFEGSKLGKVLTPDQLKAVMGVNSDASRLAEMYKLGAGQGSPTARRQAMGSFIGDNFAEQAPGLNRIIEGLGNVPGANYLTRGAAGIGNMLGSKINAGIAQKLETMMASDPQAVQAILAKVLAQQGQPGNPMLAQILRTAPVALASQASP